MKPTKTLISIYFLTSAAGLLLAAIFSAWSGGSSERALLFGLSAQRVTLLGGAFLPFAGLIYLGFRTWQKGIFISPDIWLTVSLAVVFIVGWYFVWTPAEYFGKLYFYLTRIQPLTIWLTCFSGMGLLLMLVLRFGLHPKNLEDHLHIQKLALCIAAVSLVVFALIAFAAFQLTVGITSAEEDFWYGASVPILPLQVVAALAAGFIFSIFESKHPRFFTKKRHISLDIILFIVIWVVVAFLWAREPVRKNFLITMPTGPNAEFYPFADAMGYDISSQFALIGQGINNNLLYDRPLYISLLVLFHSLGGQDYELVAAIQSSFFAVLPALLYLLGKLLDKRGVGISLAVLASLRSINSMTAATWIDTSMPKQLLTEYPTAIGLIIATLLSTYWLKNPQKNWKYALWAGGTLGLTMLVRSHVFAIVLILLMTAVAVSLPNWKRGIFLSLAIFATILAGILPWYIYNSSNASLADNFLLRVRAVISTRYTPVPPTPAPTPQGNLQTHPKVAKTEAVKIQRTFIEFASANFTHNLTMSVLGFPARLTNYNLEATIKETESYWDAYWDGIISPIGIVFITLNLIVIAWGIGIAFQRNHWAGIVPLVVFLAYHAINALARTSGGRYLIPVDWVVLFYYVLGLICLVRLFAASFGAYPIPVSDAHSRWDLSELSRKHLLFQGVSIILTFAFLGSLIPLSGTFFPTRYQIITKKQAIELFQREQDAVPSRITNANLNAFLKQKNSVALVGRSLYPRHYDMNKGEPLPLNAYIARGYPRLVFSLIGPAGNYYIILPGRLPEIFPNATDSIVIGCREKDTIQALVVILPQEQVVYSRSPLSQFTCPLPEPVCDNNRNCR